MEPTHVIKRPLITEKSTFEAAGSIPRGKRAGRPLNRYAFEVDMRARKGDIAKAIEAIYNVRQAQGFRDWSRSIAIGFIFWFEQSARRE